MRDSEKTAVQRLKIEITGIILFVHISFVREQEGKIWRLCPGYAHSCYSFTKDYIKQEIDMPAVTQYLEN